MTQHTKRIKDSFGDVTAIVSDSDSITIHVTAYNDDNETEMIFTPERARKLANHLLKAANRAEGSNAAAVDLPRVFIDRDGSIWYLCPDGLYWCGGLNVKGSRPLMDVKSRFGSWGDDGGDE